MFTIAESQAFLMQTEQETQERRIVNPRRGRFDTEKSSGNSTAQARCKKDGWRRQKQTAEQRVHHPMKKWNELGNDIRIKAGSNEVKKKMRQFLKLN